MFDTASLIVGFIGGIIACLLFAGVFQAGKNSTVGKR
jgi:hypothetical protein